MNKMLLIVLAGVFGSGCAASSVELHVSTAVYGALAAAKMARTYNCVEPLIMDGRPNGRCVLPNGGVALCAQFSNDVLCKF